jgi:hypothetical protein
MMQLVRWTVRLVALAAMAVAIAGLASMFHWFGIGVPTPTLGPPPPGPPDPARLACPPAAARPEVTAELLDRPGGPGPIVPTGAVSARLCIPGDTRWQLGRVMLLKRIDELIAAVNALPGYRPGKMCTKEGGPLYMLVLGYPAGQRVIVGVSDTGCEDVVVGDQIRAGGGRVVAAYSRLAGTHGVAVPAAIS